jgi:hypothetical protein
MHLQWPLKAQNPVFDVRCSPFADTASRRRCQVWFSTFMLLPVRRMFFRSSVPCASPASVAAPDHPQDLIFSYLICSSLACSSNEAAACDLRMVPSPEHVLLVSKPVPLTSCFSLLVSAQVLFLSLEVSLFAA